MGHVAQGSVIQQIGAIFDGSAVAGLTDRQLLERFIAGSDFAGEAAFAALVARHGPMVLRVCRQFVGNPHDAEDAFQAVFLVLARRARSIRNPELLGNWLYGVSLKTARCARLRIDRQRKNEMAVTMSRREAISSAVMDRSALTSEDVVALHLEIARLPDLFRLPVVLCYFEGLTLDEAAQRLNWPAGTLRSRMARARDKLRRRLSWRGVSLSGAVLATALSPPRSASAQISTPLCNATTRAAISFAARHGAGGAVSASAAATAQEVIRSMVITKLKFVALALLALGAVATGSGYLAHGLETKDEPPRFAAVQQPPAAKAGEPRRPAPGRMTVVGRVLDPMGKPVAGVVVDVMGRARKPVKIATTERETGFALGHGTTDATGRFQLDAPRTSSDSYFPVYAMAGAPGFGLGWIELNSDAQQPEATIRLRDEQVIQGRLVDVNGRPAAGVGLRVIGIGKHTDRGLFDGVTVNGISPEGLHHWPALIKTDPQGRFTLGRAGRNLSVHLIVDDDRFPPLRLTIDTDDRPGPKEITLALEPVTIVEGVVLAADTGEPVANATVRVGSTRERFNGGSGPTVNADAHGRFSANVKLGQYYRVEAIPPAGAPYLITEESFEWTKGAVKKSVEIKVPRGVLIRGKVAVRGTGQPLGNAQVQCYPAGNRDRALEGWRTPAVTAGDGSFQITVPPGKGHLFAFGPNSGFILEEIGSNALASGRPGGDRHYAHQIVAYEVKEGDSPREMEITLRPGKTVRGHVRGPAGETVADAAIITRLHIVPTNPTWRGDFQLHARDGEFTLHGLDPDQSAPVSFLDADHEWGATVELSGKLGAQDLAVRLQPCGRATARFVGPDGKPVVRRFPEFEILGTPGPPRFTTDKIEQAKLAADAAYMPNVDRKHYWKGPFTDDEGRITLPALIPGALYRITDDSNEKNGARIRKDFTVKPGETLDLGDILIEKPTE